MKKRLLYTILSISLLTVMAGAAIAPALGVISAHFEGRNPLLIQLIVSLPALFIILTNLFFPWLCRLMKTRTLALTGLALYVLSGAGAFFEEFGDATGSSVNFTEYGAAANGTSLTEEIRRSVYLLNPMNFIGDSKATNAPHWYVRHGSRDRDTSFPIPVAFATKLENAGLDVDFLLAWNRPHSGDYALDEVFDWIRRITTR